MPQAPDVWNFATHEVTNQPAPLVDVNLFAGDSALREGVAREGAATGLAEMEAFGAACGSEARLELGRLANAIPPQLATHDRYGQRIDVVSYHPAYHALMRGAIEAGLHAAPWRAPGPGAHVARAARFYLQTQVEAGHLRPITMTFACVPVIAREPGLAALWLPKILSDRYDARDLPLSQKHGATVGMAITEKQGGSDIRANATTATPTGDGESWRLVGHKYFVSAPMSDAFLVLAQAEPAGGSTGGLTCFLMPRWLEETRNFFEIVRLKPKMGNVSNATAEIELRGALAWRIGAEGRGLAAILGAVAMTRFDCMAGSAAGMRAALAQALDHCRQRMAFGRALADQPLMRVTLADLALEAEAALALVLRVARALDASENPAEAALARAAVPLGKYWLCKRAPGHASEAMECIGGSGFIEDGPMPRLYREAPVNAIWEGGGNIQCLDLLRAFSRQPETAEALLGEIEQARGLDGGFDREAAALRAEFAAWAACPEGQARAVAERLACALQASLMLRGAPSAVAQAFCRSRLGGAGGRLYGALAADADLDAILTRAAPR